jgi:hypothetical protein
MSMIQLQDSFFLFYVLSVSTQEFHIKNCRFLIPFFERALRREKPLWGLRVENCDLSSIGVTKILECLTSGNKPLDVLSIADNHLGR